MKILRIGLLVGFLALTVGSPVYSKDPGGAAPEDLFRQASAAYKAENYDKAVELYEAIVAQGKVSGAVFYNLGNSYMKKKEIGKAILNFERAKDFLPRDPDLKANEKFAYSQLRVDQVTEGNFFNRLVHHYQEYFTTNELTILIFVFFFLTGAFYYAGLFLKWPPQLHLALIILSTVCLFFNGAMFTLKIGEQSKSAIVLTDTEARFEPLKDSSVHYQLNEGDKISFVRQESGWLKVQRKDRKEGWIPQSAAGKIQLY